MKQECRISKHLSYHHEMSIPRGQRTIMILTCGAHMAIMS